MFPPFSHGWDVSMLTLPYIQSMVYVCLELVWQVFDLYKCLYRIYLIVVETINNNNKEESGLNKYLILEQLIWWERNRWIQIIESTEFHRSHMNLTPEKRCLSHLYMTVTSCIDAILKAFKACRKFVTSGFVTMWLFKKCSLPKTSELFSASWGQGQRSGVSRGA